MRLWMVLLCFGFAFAQNSKNLPEPYDQLEWAIQNSDTPELRRLADQTSFAGLWAKKSLAQDPALAVAERAAYAWGWAKFLEQARAFEPGWSSESGWQMAAPLLEAAGLIPEAREAYENLVPDKKAVEALTGLFQGDALYQSLFNGRAYKELLELLPPFTRPDLRAQSLFRLGRYADALGVYRVWAERETRGMVGLGWCLYMLERYEEALEYLRGVGSQESRYVQGLALEALQRHGEANRLYQSSTFAGRWRGAGLLERRGASWLALTQYLQLAQEETLYADDARYRAWVLAGRLGDEKRQQRIQAELGGGLAILAGKPLRLTVAEPNLSDDIPKAVSEAEALRLAGKYQWARGVLRYALLQAPGPRTRLMLVKSLQTLGAYREALKVTDGLIAGGMPLTQELLEAAYPRAYREWVEQYAEAYKLEPNLLYAVIRVESRFDPYALSITGAKGLMQFVPGTWQSVAQQLGESPGNPFDAETSIRYGAYYLRWLLGRCRDTSNPKLCAISSYNGGIGYFLRGLAARGNIDDFLRFQERDEPREYLEKVLEAEAYYKTLYP